MKRHEWTNGGDEVLIVKCTTKDGKGYGDFQYPETAGEIVTAPDWNTTNACGGGLHGWPWGVGIGDGKEPDYAGRWYVIGVIPTDIVGELQGGVQGGVKCKFRTGTIRYVGPWAGALSFTLTGRIAYDAHVASGSASNSGERGSASNSGWRGSASNSGWRGSASNSGERGSASNSGASGSASNSGWRGSASNSGWRGSASTEHTGTAAICTGLNSRAKAAEFGCIALAWWNSKENRVEMRCALTGKKLGELKPDTWYGLDADGKFVEVV